MILVDTSVWIDFFRQVKTTEVLKELLVGEYVVMHPWILGELRLGQLGNKRRQVLADLKRLDCLGASKNNELFDFIERRRLYGKGLSLIDVELLYATIVTRCLLWTHDKNLERVAKSAGCAFYP